MSAMKVLLGYSESHGAARLVDEAINRTRGRDAFVYVVTSMLGHGELPGAAGEAGPGTPGAGTGQDRYVDDIQAAERSLARVKEEFARRHEVDEIILGARKHSLLGEVLAGSTERHVTAQAPCPVVLVPLD